MAVLTYFTGTQVPLSVIGMLKKVKYNEPNPDLEKRVHAVIPVKNEEFRIPYALGSLLAQDYRRLKITVINNLSTDKTYEVSKRIAMSIPERYEPRVLNNPEPGKTPSIKMALKSRPNCDLTFILDADTYLTDSNYISTLAAQFDKPKVGSAYGTVKPIRPKGVKIAYEKFVKEMFSAVKNPKNYGLEDIILASIPKIKFNILNKMVVSHRASLYSFDQNFVKKGQMGLYGSTLFPVGCGVLYDTELLSRIFSDYEKTLGNNLTNSEDIFLGFAVRDRGRANYYVPSIHMETAEPPFSKYFKQNNMWVSSFMQSAYYFRKNTFKMLSRKNPERAMGASIVFPLIEKVSYPTLLGLFAALGDPRLALGAIPLEMVAHMAVNFCVAEKGYKFKSIADTLFSEPLRIASFFSELGTSAIFVKDLVTKNRNWRK